MTDIEGSLRLIVSFVVHDTIWHWDGAFYETGDIHSL